MRTLGLALVLALVLALIRAPFAAASLVEAGSEEVGLYVVGGDVDVESRQPALSYDRFDDRHLAVWTEDVADGQDVLGGFLDSALGTNPVFAGGIDGRTGAARDPDTAFCPDTRRHLVIWAQEHAPGAFEVFGRRVEPDGTFDGPAFRISDAGTDDTDAAFDALHPAVASDEQGNFLVVWHSDDDRDGLADGDFEVFLRIVPATDGSLGPIQRLTTQSATGGLDSLRPDVAYRRARGDYLIGFETDADPGPDYVPNGFLAIVPATGLLSAPPAGASRPLAEVSAEPRRVEGYAWDIAVSSAALGANTLVVYRSNGSSGALVSTRIAGQVFDGDLATVGFVDVTDPQGTLGPACRVDDPAVTYSWISGSWVVVWSGVRSGSCATGSEIFAAVVGRDATMPAAAPLVISGLSTEAPTADAVTPAVVASNSSAGDVLAVWCDDRATADDYGLYGQFLNAAAAVSAPSAPRALSVVAAPNPFNPMTRVRFTLPAAGEASVDVYDLRGRHVRALGHGSFDAGTHDLRWDGADDTGAQVASGVYHVRLRHAAGTVTRKITLIE